MNDNLFELLGIPDPEAKPTVVPAPKPIQSSVLVPSGQPRQLGLHAFLAQRYPPRANQQGAFGPVPLRIDDRKETDCSNNFCDITVTVPIAINDRFTIKLIHPPWNAEVRALIQEHSGQWIDGAAETKIVLTVRLKKHGILRELARSIRTVINVQHVTRTGKRYPIADWRWLAGRTAASLDTLADTVWDFRKARAKAGCQVPVMQTHSTAPPGVSSVKSDRLND